MSHHSSITSKLCTIEDAINQVEKWKKNGEKVVFTNGCFDILHKGHVAYLAKAADLGTKLVVGINSDASVKSLGKGDDRPINNQSDRQWVLAGLESINLIVVFNDSNPLTLIEKLSPSILAKGADYDPLENDPEHKKYIVGSSYVKALGGKVIAIELEEGYSTTKIIQKLKP